MARHTLKGDADRNCWLDGKPLYLAKSLKVANHSPDGFNWGYGGSGPAQLAAAVVLELTGGIDGYQEFKWNVISRIPGGPFEIEFSFDGVSSGRTSYISYPTQEGENG